MKEMGIAMGKILNFGSCNLDHVYKMTSIVQPGETAASLDMQDFPGGKGLNQSVALARAGMNVYHAGCIGGDGGMLTEVLRNAGVDVSLMRVCDVPTGHAVIQVDATGQNSILLFAGANHAVTKSYADEVLSSFGAGDFLVLQNEINLVDYIARRGFERGMCVVFNPSPYNAACAAVDLYQVGYLILNETETFALCKQRQTEQIAAWFRRTYPHLRVVLTLGAQGCVYIDRDRILPCPAFSVQVKDTTGAGDTFLGYFTAAVAQGVSVEQALRTASAASALAITKEGASVSIPTAQEVENFLQEHA